MVNRIILQEQRTGLGDNLMAYMGWYDLCKRLNIPFEMEWSRVIAPFAINCPSMTSSDSRSAPAVSVRNRRVPWHEIRERTGPLSITPNFKPLDPRLLGPSAPFHASPREILLEQCAALVNFFRATLDVKSIQREIDTELIQAKRRIDHKTIAIHLRIGGGTGRDKTFASGLKQIQENFAIRMLNSVQRVTGRVSTIVAACDFPMGHYKELLFAIFGRDIDIVTAPGASRHVLHGIPSPADWIKIILDLQFISLCPRVFMTQNSNFSRIGALMGLARSYRRQHWCVSPAFPYPMQIGYWSLLYKPSNEL